ncbi:MAG: HlyC/CorC family transporter [Nitrospira sp. SB0677_bin_15]|nr:HlyC/CorC family transporter [Nitrospira sp. SB0667_bin_9]MYD31505.1 HlyC/CorC family transporter [Nitrospira sp. SB0661_bin_20]MYG40115.1 HlyC/CorC family transporter [Nitrospira sp. SB0677_bin_15]MYH02488.1 HlyC/CorC family transporter [Nitrospira sp. SB0675_bin_23]MYJ22260.1 HlyC/CorC family transporter [Nitrospira sp. SB0673_bin_12]
MEYIAIVICLLLSGLFSGAEIAFFSLSETKLQTMAEEGRRAAKLALSLRQNPQRLLSTILIGNNVVNLTAAALISMITFEHFGSEAVAIATGALTVFVLIFGEIVPKTLCAKYAPSAVQFFSYMIYWMEKLFTPALFLLEPLILKLTGGRGLAVPFVTKEELKIMIEAGGKAGILESEKVEMIKNLFEFTELTAKDVMTPRIDTIVMDSTRSLDDAKDDLFSIKHSRIPVYEDIRDNITGILYRTHALIELAQGNRTSQLKELALPPLFIPISKPVGDLLKQFQQEKRHIAIVVNEFGGVMGIVTTEDLLEEVVGDILDETDVTEELIKRTGKDEILVSGRTEVRKINEFLKVALDKDEDVVFYTISGLIQQHLGHIPAVGEELRVAGCLLTIRDADNRSIKSVQIHKLEDVSQEEPEPAQAV